MVVKYIQRSRLKNKELFDRLFTDVINTGDFKKIEKGLVTDSFIIMGALNQTVPDMYSIHVLRNISEYIDQYRYTVMIND